MWLLILPRLLARKEQSGSQLPSTHPSNHGLGTETAEETDGEGNGHERLGTGCDGARRGVGTAPWARRGHLQPVNG